MDWKNTLPFVNTGLLLFIAITVTYGTFISNNNQGRSVPKKPAARPPAQVTNIDMAKISQGAYSKGAQNPKATIVVFNSFTCGFCSRAWAVTNKLLEQYPNEVKLVYRHYNRNETDIAAAEAVECAGEQGKFWEMYDTIFSEGAKLDFVPYAGKIGIDQNRFAACMKASKYRQKTIASTDDARRLGITGTPAFVIDGTLSAGYQPYEAFERMVKKFF